MSDKDFDSHVIASGGLADVLVHDLHRRDLLFKVTRMAQDVDVVAYGELLRQFDPGDADVAKPVVDFADEFFRHFTLSSTSSQQTGERGPYGQLCRPQDPYLPLLIGKILSS
jgi:hypothetical protein